MVAKKSKVRGTTKRKPRRAAGRAKARSAKPKKRVSKARRTEPRRSKAEHRWRELRLTVPAAIAEDAAASLFGEGALGCEERPSEFADRRLLIATYPITLSPEAVEAGAARALGSLGLDFASAEPAAAAREDRDWAESWKQFFKPLRLGERLFVVPSWEKFAPPKGSVVLDLDPGMAFGTGQHATTALCAAALEGYLDSVPPSPRAALRVLDLGCGSGILAMFAAKLGVRQVVATDNDPEAVDVARDNAKQNSLGKNLVLSTTPLHDLDGPFDLIVANILAETLIELAPAILGQLAPGGRLLLSGILATQAGDVEAAYSARGATRNPPMARQSTAQEGDWVAMWFE